MGGEPVGRRWVAWSDEECRFVDLALLPEHRRRGIGAQVTQEVIDEAGRRGVPVRLSVERTNAPSLALCARLGFCETDGDDVYVSLERLPASSA